MRYGSALRSLVLALLLGCRSYLEPDLPARETARQDLLVAEQLRESETYQLVISLPNMGEASNGDRVAVTGGGTFTVNPKSVMNMAGAFTHTDNAGTVLGAGTWAATQLLAFQPYGCGIVTFPDPDVTLPPNFCGGMLKLRVVLTTPIGAFDGILTVFCIVGPNPPDSHDEPAEEGATLDIIDVINFNQVAPGGTNIYIRTNS